MEFRVTIINIPDAEFKKFYQNVISFAEENGSSLPLYTNRNINIDFNRVVELDQMQCISDIFASVLATEAMIAFANKSGY